MKTPQIELKSAIINTISGLSIDGNVVINGQTNNLLINSLNSDPANYTLESISGVFKNVKNDKKVKDAPQVTNIGKTLISNSTTPYVYSFPSEFKTGDLKLEVSVTVRDDERISHVLDAFTGVLKVVEPKQTFDLEMLSIYALLAGIAYFVLKFVYETYINPLSPGEKKNKAKENKPSAPISPVKIEEQKEGNDEWLPELAKLKQRKNKGGASSADETSGDDTNKKGNKKNKKAGRK